MAGGTWTAQNKGRPGAYINFESVPTPSSSVGTRGIMTMPVPMSWGPADTIIELYSADLLSGASLPKIGMTAFDPESLIYRAALAHAYLAKIYRLDTGGTKSTAMVGTLNVSAKYAGTIGNRISVAVAVNVVDNTLFDVITYLSGAERDRQTAPATGEGLLSNDWVDFTTAGDLTAAAGTALTGGTNGTVESATFADYFAAANETLWNTMAIPLDDAAVKAQADVYIRNKRDNTGRKVQAVLVDYANADFEGVISVDQGYNNLAGEALTPTIFAAKYAGMTAAAAINESLTYYAITDADTIINPIKDENVEAALKAGKIVLTRRQDGAVVVEQDINSLHTFTPYKNYSFSKNRVIRVLDDIGNQVMVKFENAYIGKVDNNDIGRAVFRADIVSYMNELQDMGAIQNFDPSSDITVTQGMDIDAVRVDLWVKPVDSMEKLYMQVFVGGDA